MLFREITADAQVAALSLDNTGFERIQDLGLENKIRPGMEIEIKIGNS